MYEQRIWIPFNNKSLQKVSLHSGNTNLSEKEAHDVLDKFVSECWTAFELMTQKSFVEARKMLSAGFSSLRSILQYGHPDTMNYFFQCFYELTHGRFKQLGGVLDLLRDYMLKLATLVLPEHHPWRVICCSWGSMNKAELVEAVLLSMKSHANVLEQNDGRFSPLSVQSRLAYIRSRYGCNFPEEEVILRHLLADVTADAQAAGIAPSDGMFNTMKYLARNLKLQGRYREYEDVAKELVVNARVFRQLNPGHAFQNVHLSSGLTTLAMAQYQQGKEDQAETNMRESVGIVLSKANSWTWAIQKLNMLESWVREWGRIADADKIKEEINGLIELDTAGKEEMY